MQTRVRFRGAGLVVALVMLLAAVGLVASPATSTPGVNDYPSKLKSADRDALVDPWLFYNRECTSFTAWRLNHDNWGLPYGSKKQFWNYYDGQHWGNANHWATAARAAGIRVDTTPRVGAVAYWMSGSFGHVAWVRYVNKSSVTIEEYNYVSYGGYSTRTLTKGASNYPTGFIHVHDLGWTSRPRVSGTPQVGQTLTASRGTWVLPGGTYSYQWLADGTAIPGATGTTYTPTSDEIGDQISVRVTAQKPGIRAMRVTSRVTAAVAPDIIDNTTPPMVTGQPEVDQPLTADPGTWSVTNGAYSYQWIADGEDIAGATGTTFTPRAAQVDAEIAVRVTVTAPGYQTATATSDSVGPVQPGTIDNTRAPVVTGTPRLGAQLVASPGSWSVKGASYDYQWMADGSPLPSATGATLVPDSDLLGKRLSVQVVAAAPGYVDQTAVSQPSDAVAPGTIEVTSGPSVGSRPVVGHPLWSRVGGITTPGVRVTRQWLRDGRVLTGQTGSSYTPTRADIGRRLALRVTLQRQDFTTLEETSPLSAPVRVTPWLTAAHSTTSHRVTLDISVGARRAPTPTGRVRVTRDSALVRRPLLESGAAETSIGRLTRGWHTFTVTYVGDRYHTGKSATMRIWIPG